MSSGRTVKWALAIAVCLVALGFGLPQALAGDGEGTATLKMNTRSDLDLHGYFPFGGGVHIWYAHKSEAGAYLVQDENVPDSTQ